MIDLSKYGYTYTTPLPNGQIPARVTDFRRDQYKVISPMGELTAMLKGAFVHEAQTRDDLPCVGDFVWLQYNLTGVSLITTLLPRRTKFSRLDSSGHAYAHIKANREQIVAANFDYVFIVTSLNRDFRVNRILRYLTQARASGAIPVIILTKADLCEDFTHQVTEVNLAAPDIAVHAVSSHTGFGLDTLNRYLQPGKTVVFLGMSGVGKSSLLNALVGEDIMTVRETREKVDVSKGQHTTTHRQLFMLPSKAMVIDTPGMRELGIYDAEDSISIGFADIEDLFTQCRFRDCSHNTEPGCAVLAALKNGSLAENRWEQYQTQKRENSYFDDKAAFMRERHETHKSWAKSHKAERKSLKNGGKMR